MKKIIITSILLLFCLISICSAKVRYDDPAISKEVNILRKFRDHHLKKYRAGRAFIDYYYKYGPTAADAIKKRDRLRSLVRLCLLPLMYAGKNFDAVLLFIKIFAGLLVFVFFWYVYFKIKKIPPENKRIDFLYN
jgi:hypothetical protein